MLIVKILLGMERGRSSNFSGIFCRRVGNLWHRLYFFLNVKHAIVCLNCHLESVFGLKALHFAKCTVARKDLVSN